MGPNDGWLFREGDLILGPVPAKQIIDKLNSGELTGHSEVQPVAGGGFRPVGQIPEFKVHVAKAQAKARVEKDEAAHHAGVKQRTLKAIGIALGVLVLLGIIVAVVGSYLAVHAPTDKSAEELVWGDMEITIDTPTIAAARRTDNDEYVDLKSLGTGGAGGSRPTTVATRPPLPKDPGTKPSNPTTPKQPSMGKADNDGLQMGEVDQGAINGVIGKYKPTLYGCLKEVAKPGMVAKVPIEFAIGGDGKVTKVWVDNSDFKNGPLPDCLLKQLQKWPFKPQPGGGATVQLSFNIGRKG